MSDFENMPLGARALMQEAAKTFRFYEVEHRKKTGDLAMRYGAHSQEALAGMEKIDRNRVMAEKIEAVLRG